MKNKRYFIIVAIFLLAVLGFFLKTEISKPTTLQPKPKKLQVVTSLYPMYFFASRIGGDRAEVYNITPAGTEPHDYEPTTKDIVKIMKSNMLVLNGGQIETWGNKIKDQIQGANVQIVVAGLGLTDKNPHVWLSPILAKKQVEAIGAGFEKIDPKDSAYFRGNTEKLKKELDQLDSDFRKGLRNCQKKDFITSHAAFGYLAAEYSLNQIAISGISPDEEPSSQGLAEISDLVKKEGLKVIFFESLVSPKLSQTIARETGAKTLALDPVEGLTEDSLKAGKNYLTVMKDNLSNLQKALQCN